MVEAHNACNAVAEGRLHVCASKCLLLAEHEVQRRAYAPHVRLQAAPFLEDDLRGAKPGRASHPQHRLAILERTCEAEVREHRCAVGAEHDVLGLYIPVHQAERVHVRQAAHHVADDRPRVPLREGFGLHHVIQLADAQLHRQAELPACLLLLAKGEEATELHDVGVGLQSHEGGDLVLNRAGRCRRIPAEALRRDRVAPVQGRCPYDLGGGAGPQRRRLQGVFALEVATDGAVRRELRNSASRGGAAARQEEPGELPGFRLLPPAPEKAPEAPGQRRSGRRIRRRCR
mmetsp:Transcript_80657/g.233244  ORF Transcript_80657/g.233244 Transcript_80657/m.233244 type:complete len:288 (+) Transcript_80657:410-1273(+)